MRLVDKMALRGMVAKNRIMNKAANMLGMKEAGVDGIVVAMILIVSAVFVGFIFRNQIGQLVNTMMTKANTQIDTMFSQAIS